MQQQSAAAAALAAAQQQRNRQLQQQQQQAELDVLPNERGMNEPPEDYYISDLYQQLSSVLAAKPTEIDPLRIGRNSFLASVLLSCLYL